MRTCGRCLLYERSTVVIGIIMDVLAVAAGGLAGAQIGRWLPPDFAEKINKVFAVCAVGMGINSIILMKNMPAVILSVTLGSVIGLLLKISCLIERGAVQLEKQINSVIRRNHVSDADRDSDLSLVVTAIVLFCASGTGIYGCLDAGMTGNATILFSKSILDFFTAAIFACSAGIIISVIALPQFVVFLLLFSLARMIVPLTTETMISDFKACGGFILVATGFRMGKIADFPIADMLPAMILVMPLSALWLALAV